MGKLTSAMDGFSLSKSPILLAHTTFSHPQ